MKRSFGFQVDRSAYAQKRRDHDGHAHDDRDGRAYDDRDRVCRDHDGRDHDDRDRDGRDREGGLRMKNLRMGTLLLGDHECDRDLKEGRSRHLRTLGTRHSLRTSHHHC